MKIILASQSPRRKEILSCLGMKFDILVPDVDESSDIRDPAVLVRTLSERKGLAARELLLSGGVDLSDTIIISSDTLVYCDGKVLGKPHDRADAARMMRLLSGRVHSVFSGIAVCRGKDECVADASETRVSFAHINDAALERYLDSCEYADKAGAYAIQEAASMFINGIYGDYFTVVGLPVRKLYEMLNDMGIDMQSLCDGSKN